MKKLLFCIVSSKIMKEKIKEYKKKNLLFINENL